jgi:hypothetical protein
MGRLALLVLALAVLGGWGGDGPQAGEPVGDPTTSSSAAKRVELAGDARRNNALARRPRYAGLRERLGLLVTRV